PFAAFDRRRRDTPALSRAGFCFARGSRKTGKDDDNKTQDQDYLELLDCRTCHAYAAAQHAKLAPTCTPVDLAVFCKSDIV
ncbi:MAG TPA: hypothetical protein VKI44_22305, partial [Acetobacteraceae bacterium]|nr:hypothetical protein [Acetobacteraceae bacterium]